MDSQARKADAVAEAAGHADVAAAIRAYAEKQGTADASSAGKPVRRSLFGVLAAGNVQALRELLDEFPGLFSARFLNRTPMQLAVTMNKKDVVALLLERGADPNVVVDVPTGRTALHEAANRGYIEMVQTLLKAGADAKAVNKLDQTPLDLANQNKFEDVAKLLQ